MHDRRAQGRPGLSEPAPSNQARSVTRDPQLSVATGRVRKARALIRAAGARDQYATRLPITEQVSGPEHPDTLTNRSNLAAWTGEAGDAAGARDQFAPLLPVFERALGPEHPVSLRSAEQ